MEGGSGVGGLLQRVGVTHSSVLVSQGSKPGAQTVDVSSGADGEGGVPVGDGLVAAGAPLSLAVDFDAAREQSGAGIRKQRIPSATSSSFLQSSRREWFFFCFFFASARVTSFTCRF